MSEDEDVNEKLVWISHRLEILDEVDKRLKEMKRIAEYARDNELQEREKEELDRIISKIGKEVQVLYEKDKNYWKEWQ